MARLRIGLEYALKRCRVKEEAANARRALLPKVNTDEYLIWWIPDGGFVEKVYHSSKDATDFPEYLRRNLSDAAGRCGHGRLWIPSVEGKAFPDVVFTESAVCIRAQDCCGIIIEKKDIGFARHALEGFVTNWEMVPV